MPVTNLIEPSLPKVDGDVAPLADHQSAPVSSTRIDALVWRIRAKYLEIPGLGLSVDEAQRLWQLSQTECEALLAALVDAGFLRRTRGGAFTQAGSSAVAV